MNAGRSPVRLAKKSDASSWQIRDAVFGRSWDIPLELQPKLLRVLQEQEFERLGSNRTQRVDVRV